MRTDHAGCEDRRRGCAVSIPSSRETLGEIPGLVGALSGPVTRPRGCRVFQSGLCLQQSVQMVLVEGNKAGAAREGSRGPAPCGRPALQVCFGFVFSFALVEKQVSCSSIPENIMYKNIALSGCQCEASGVLWAGPGRDPPSPVDRRCLGVRVLEVRNALASRTNWKNQQ